jgi:hypothetical protein
MAAHHQKRIHSSIALPTDPDFKAVCDDYHTPARLGSATAPIQAGAMVSERAQHR